MPATVVSLFPKSVDAHKPGLFPNRFLIPASDGKNVVVYHVDDKCFNTRTIPTEEDPIRRTLIIPESADVIAASIVNDEIRSSFLADEDCSPALFWKSRVWSPEQIELEFSLDLANAKEKQYRWFDKLLRDGDDNWQTYRKHIAINDLHRMAARFLGVEREWAKKPRPAHLKECRFCTSMIPDAAVVCPECKQVVDKEKFDEMSA